MKSRTIRIVVVTLLVQIALVALIAVVVIGTGAYDVAATSPHLGLTRTLLSAVTNGSVHNRARDVEISATYDSPDIDEGIEHYRAMCVGCHGAPGIERNDIGGGLNPQGPDLAEEATELSPQEVFWVLKHGIKMTGMPAFGPTHDDEKLWNITAFVKRLPDMTAGQYRELAEGGEHHEETHSH